MMTEDFYVEITKPNYDANEITKKNYDTYGVKYSIYEEKNQFFGTPIPDGFKAVYINDGIVPASLQLRKLDK